jgi:TetR/AcrR family transcriptional regulator
MATMQTPSTEEHIKAIARRVFIEKGYAATTTRDIAEGAETNVALINYYFRSKEKLFETIFQDVALSFFGGMLETFNKDIPLRAKFEAIIDKDVEFMLENPEIPVFVMNQLTHNSSDFFEKFLNKSRLTNSLLMKQMDIAIQNGEMRNLKFHECFALIIGSLQFAFIAKPLVKHLGDLNEPNFNAMVNEHKERVKEMVLGYLFLK